MDDKRRMRMGTHIGIDEILIATQKLVYIVCYDA